MRRALHSMRRVGYVAAFVTALILLTGTPAKVREVALNEAERTSESEIKEKNPDVVLLPEPGKRGPLSVEEAIAKRRSVRSFRDTPVLLPEVSQLLWAAQGITEEGGDKRAAPSAGATYPLEIYVVAGNVEDLMPGVYHYKPSDHSIEIVRRGDLRAELCDEALSQEWIEEAALNIVIACVYERTMDRYGARGVRYVQVEAGAVAENIYLQAETIGLGTTLVGSFSDEGVAKLLRIEAKPLGIMPIGVPMQ
jgi:SagB-type dehydrogenase family enzyme